jgi:steroid 5-alpha reductase family enzyme
MTSFLEKQLESAKEGELTPDNTHPAVFLFLACVQLPFMLWVSWLLDIDGLAVVAVVATLVHVCMGLLSFHVLRTNMYFDLVGEATMFLLVGRGFAASARTPRQARAAALALLWCGRLGWFLFARIYRRPGHVDFRFDNLLKAAHYNLFGWVSQATWVWLQGFCLWALFASPPDAAGAPFGAGDAVGALTFAVGFGLEIVADRQKSAFNAAAHAGGGRNPRFIASGLWKFSRHPNFFGEILIHVGLSLACAGGVPKHPAVGGMPVLTKFQHMCGVSPVWSAMFLFFTSLMLLEKRADEKWGGQDDYERYKRATSILLPWWPSAAAQVD